MTPAGVEVEGKGLLNCDAGMYQVAEAFVKEHAAALAGASQEFEVPVEFLIACALTQSQGNPARKFVWRDPGYVGDSSTPDRISTGVCRMLVSTAQFFMKDPAIDHFWLLDLGNALRACGAYVRHNHATLKTGWDPVLVACAFNAGGLYEDQSPGNVWRLKQYSMLLGFHGIADARTPDHSYATVFSQYFAAARRAIDADLLKGCVRFPVD